MRTLVNKQTGTIITAVMAVLFGCAGVFTYLTGILHTSSLVRGFGASAVLGAGDFAGLGANICMSLGFIALPVVFYITLVANNKQETSAAAPETESKARDAPAQ